MGLTVRLPTMATCGNAAPLVDVAASDDLYPQGRLRECALLATADALSPLARTQESARWHATELHTVGETRSGWRRPARRRCSPSAACVPTMARRGPAAPAGAIAGTRRARCETGGSGLRLARRRAPRRRRGVARRLLDHRFAEAARRFSCAGRRPAAPARRGAARRAIARRDDARARASRRVAVPGASVVASSCTEARAAARHLEDAALRHRAGAPSTPARSARGLVQVERGQLGVLDHRDRVLDAGRDADRPR